MSYSPQVKLKGSISGFTVDVSASATTTAYELIWPATQGAVGTILTNDGLGNLSWSPPAVTGVTSVALSLPSIFSVSGSPVTTTGTLTGTLNTQSANTVWAGPTTGPAAQPTFRALVSADIPSLSAVYLPLTGGTISGFITAANFSGSSSGDNTGDVTLAVVGSTPNIYGASLSGQILTLQPANTSFPGVLTAADWNTFNNKQPAGSYITALTGEVSASGPGSATATISNAAVIAKLLTGFVSGAGTVSASDSILTAIQKIDGNTTVVSANAANRTLSNLTSPTAINQDLLPDTTLTRYLGSNTKWWAAAYIGAVYSEAVIAPTSTLLLQTAANADINATPTAAVFVQSGDKTAGTGDSGPVFVRSGTSAGGLRGAVILDGIYISASGVRITDVADPTSPQDAATKAYVDAIGPAITALTGDATAVGPGSAVLTLATVNANVGTFGTASSVSTFTVNAKGLITAASNTPIQITESQVTNLVTDLAGKQATGNYITALTGDVVATGPGSVSATIQPNAVTNSKLAQMPALTIKGNNTGVTADAADLTVAQVNAILPVFTSALNGLVPASGGGTTNFLRADGTWAVAGTGSVTSVALLDGSTSPIYSISGSPVTTSGTLTFSLSTQSANTVFAGPTTGPAAQPTFRSLVSDDIPSLSAIYLPLSGGTLTGALLGTSGSFSSTLSASNLSGTNTGDVTLAPVGATPNANGASLSGQILTLQPANTSFPGVLTAADWNTFNNKQPAGNYITDLTGDATATGPGSAVLTFATVNANVGTFGTASSVGTFTVNAKGLITAASNTPIQITESQVTNLVSDLAGKQATLPSVYDQKVTIVASGGNGSTTVNGPTVGPITLPAGGTYVGAELQVYLNGQFLFLTDDWTATSTTSVTFVDTLQVGDVIHFLKLRNS